MGNGSLLHILEIPTTRRDTGTTTTTTTVHGDTANNNSQPVCAAITFAQLGRSGRRRKVKKKPTGVFMKNDIDPRTYTNTGTRLLRRESPKRLQRPPPTCEQVSSEPTTTEVKKVKPHVDEYDYALYTSEDVRENTFEEAWIRSSLLFAMRGKHDRAKDSLDAVFRQALKELAFGVQESSDEYYRLNIISGRHLELTLLKKIRDHYKYNVNTTVRADIIEHLAESSSSSSCPDKESPLAPLVDRSRFIKYLQKLIHKHDLTPANFDGVVADVRREPSQMMVWTDVAYQRATNKSIVNRMRSIYKSVYTRWDKEAAERNLCSFSHTLIHEYFKKIQPFMELHQEFFHNMIAASELFTYLCFGFGYADSALAARCWVLGQHAIELGEDVVFWNYPLVRLYYSPRILDSKNLPVSIVEDFKKIITGTVS